jgi:hypothetical protein
MDEAIIIRSVLSIVANLCNALYLISNTIVKLVCILILVTILMVYILYLMEVAAKHGSIIFIAVLHKCGTALSEAFVGCNTSYHDVIINLLALPKNAKTQWIITIK